MSAQPIDYQSLIAPRFDRLLFWPGLEPMERDVRAETFVFPPKNQTVCDLYGYDCHGTEHQTEIWDTRFGKDGKPVPVLVRRACPWEGSNREAVPGVRPIRDLRGMVNDKGEEKNGMSALEIVRFLVGNDGISGVAGRRGVRVISGIPEKDAQIMEDAKQAWATDYYNVCAQVKASHIALNNRLRERGEAPKTPSAATRAAIDFVEMQDAASYVNRGFQCGECGIWSATEHERAKHIAASHQLEAHKYGISAGAALPPPGGVGLADVIALFQDKEEKFAATIEALKAQIAELAASKKGGK